MSEHGLVFLSVRPITIPVKQPFGLIDGFLVAFPYYDRFGFTCGETDSARAIVRRTQAAEQVQEAALRAVNMAMVAWPESLAQQLHLGDRDYPVCCFPRSF